jgi:hypothetical protein
MNSRKLRSRGRQSSGFSGFGCASLEWGYQRTYLFATRLFRDPEDRLRPYLQVRAGLTRLHPGTGPTARPDGPERRERPANHQDY